MKHPLAIDLVELVDELSPAQRLGFAHVAACEPCRRGLVNIIMSNADYPDLFDRPRVDERERKTATLFLALSVPGADPDVLDPDDVADRLAAMLNLDVKRRLDDRIMVNAIPSPQWLTAETLANLRVAAAGGAS